MELKSTVTGDPIKEDEPTPFLKDVQEEKTEPETEPTETPEDLKDIINEEVNSSIKESIDDALQEEGIDVESLKNFTDNVKDLDNKAMGNIKGMARNPENFMQNTIVSVLSRAGPHGALAGAIISLIMAAPEMVKMVVEALGVKGGPLNQDYKFSREEAFSQEFSRGMQFKRLTGDDPVITFQNHGYVAVSDPDFVGNSLVDANQARSGRVGLRNSAFGYIHGI